MGFGIHQPYRIVNEGDVGIFCIHYKIPLTALSEDDEARTDGWRPPSVKRGKCVTLAFCQTGVVVLCSACAASTKPARWYKYHV